MPLATVGVGAWLNANVPRVLPRLNCPDLSRTTLSCDPAHTRGAESLTFRHLHDHFRLTDPPVEPSPQHLSQALQNHLPKHLAAVPTGTSSNHRANPCLNDPASTTSTRLAIGSRALAGTTNWMPGQTPVGASDPMGVPSPKGNGRCGTATG